MTTTVRRKINGQYATIAEAKADLTLKVGDNVKTSGYYTAGDGGGADYVVTGGTGTDDGGSYHDMANGNQLELIIEGPVSLAKFGTGISSTANAISFALSSGNKIIVDSAKTINIPTDAATVQNILDVILTNNQSITINIESGHKLTNGWKIVDGDYSDFTITSVDAAVTLDAGFTPVSTAASPGSVSMVAVYHNVRAPVWDILLDGENNATISAISNTGGSILNVLQQKGAIRCLNGYLGSASILYADEGQFYESGFRGIWATAAATVYAKEVDCNSCGDIGVFASRATKVEMNSANVSGSGTGLRSSSSSCVMAQTLNASNCTTTGVVATFAGTAYVGAATINNCAVYGMLANEGGRIDASVATVTNCGDINVNANIGGHISIKGGTATGGTNWDLSIAQGGFIYAEGCNGVPRVTANTLSDRGVIFQ